MSTDHPGPASKQDPLRLAVVIERYDPPAGGNERSTDQIVRELLSRGHSVTVIAGSAREDAIPEGAEARVMADRKSSGVSRLLRFTKWAGRELEAGGFDASVSMTMAVPATVLEPRGGTVRETLIRNLAMRPSPLDRQWKRLTLLANPKQQALLRLERRTLADPRVAAIVALSGYVQRQLTEHYNVDEQRIAQIPNGATAPGFTDDERAGLRSSLRRGLNVPDGQTLFLFAATNPRLKGFDTLIRALVRLREQGSGAVVLLAGQYGYAHHRQIVEAEVSGMVRLLGPTRSMAELYAAVDATVLPTFYDPSSKVVLESLLAGTPAISTVYNGASDYLGPTDPGGPARGRVIADPADDAALAGAITELCDPQARTTCRSAIGDLAGELSMTRHVDRLLRVIHGVL